MAPFEGDADGPGRHRPGDPTPLLTDARASLDGHRLVWAAERARHTGPVVTLL